MEKTRLLEVLQTLDKTEWREFKKLVRSPFFNSVERLAELAEAIHDELEQGRLPAKESLFAKIFPTKSFDDQPMRLAMSQLLRLV